MKFTITGTGEESKEWPEVEYTLVAETDDYKTTIQYWANADEFKDFGLKILKFPFEDKTDVVYQYGGPDDSGYFIKLTVHLVDMAGRTELEVETHDSEAHMRFTGIIEIAALADLSHHIKITDFSTPNSLTWAPKL